MELDRYVDGLRGELMAAAEAGGDDSRALAARLTAPLESSVRLMLLEALSDAANEITLELAPGSVEVRMRGRDAELVVSPPPAPPLAPPAAAEALDLRQDDVTAGLVTSDSDDGSTARITFRLPEALKLRIEDVAMRQSMSTNAWLVRVVTAAVEQRGDRPAPSVGPDSPGSQFTGWVR